MGGDGVTCEQGCCLISQGTVGGLPRVALNALLGVLFCFVVLSTRLGQDLGFMTPVSVPVTLLTQRS